MGEIDPKPALLPCPFCGGPAKTYQYNGTTQAVCCSAEYVDCPGSTCDAPVAMWNRRATSAAAEVADLRARLAKAVEALRTLVDRNVVYDGGVIRIDCERHGDAIGAMARARTALDAIKEDRT